MLGKAFLVEILDAQLFEGNSRVSVDEVNLLIQRYNCLQLINEPSLDSILGLRQDLDSWIEGSKENPTPKFCVYIVKDLLDSINSILDGR